MCSLCIHIDNIMCFVIGYSPIHVVWLSSLELSQPNKRWGFASWPRRCDAAAACTAGLPWLGVTVKIRLGIESWGCWSCRNQKLWPRLRVESDIHFNHGHNINVNRTFVLWKPGKGYGSSVCYIQPLLWATTFDFDNGNNLNFKFPTWF